MDSGMFKGIQIAAVQALDLNQDYHSEINQIYKDRREVVYQIFDSINCTYSKDQEGMFVWARLPESVEKAEEFVESILEKTFVFMTPGFIFGSNGERYLRISLCAKKEVFEEALERIESKL
jgi:aspartate/methionine/tyrosine aminotransferase